MTHRENFERMMTRRGPRQLPLDLPMTPPVLRELERRTGFDSPTRAFDLPFEEVGCGPQGDEPAWREAIARLGFRIPPDTSISAYGFAHVRPPAESLGAADHLREMIHPLSAVTRVDQLEVLPWPRLDDPAMGRHLPEAVDRIRAAGRVAVGGMECTIFEHAWYARGLDHLFMDLIEGNGIADWLLDWHTRRSCAIAAIYARAGVDVIGLGDDVGTQHGMMMAPEFWRWHLKPRLARVVDTIRQHQGQPIRVRYHSDGDIRPILDDLIDIGVDILNPVQPECMPPDDVIERHADRLAFWGMVGTQTTMPYGRPEDVCATVERIASYARRGAAVIIAPTHVLEPDVPWANIEALVAAVRSVDLGVGGYTCAHV